MIDLSALNEIGQAIIGLVETVVSLAALHAGISIFTVFIAVWVMQATTQGAGFGSRRARLLLAQRVTIGCLAVALAFNAATPFITPDPPWLSDVPVVFGIMMLLIIIELLHRIQSGSKDDLSHDTGAGTPRLVGNGGEGEKRQSLGTGPIS